MKLEKDIFEQWSDELKSKNWFVRKINMISSWWYFEGRYLITNIKLGVKNIIYWFPIIWKDRNWDFKYTLDILKHKLIVQAEYTKEKSLHLNSERDAEKMMLCVRLIEKIYDDFYSSEYHQYHKIKTWFEPVEDKPGFSSWKSKQIEENFDDYFKKYPLIYKKVLQEKGPIEFSDENGKCTIALNISVINHERARKLLFKILEQNIENWWC
jgi:hypothetical protein